MKSRVTHATGFFFFQAEDGIRDYKVTGVQTCALPILLALAAACPMRGELTLCVRREPGFFALNRLQGDRWGVGVVDAGRAGVIGRVAIAQRVAYVHGVAAPAAVLRDLNRHPAFPRRRTWTGRG